MLETYITATTTKSFHNLKKIKRKFRHRQARRGDHVKAQGEDSHLQSKEGDLELQARKNNFLLFQ